MVEKFYSVTLLDRKEKHSYAGMGSVTTTSTYNLNEVLKHEYDSTKPEHQVAKDDFLFMSFAIIIGTGMGAVISLLILKKPLLSFTFFLFIILGIIAGFMFYALNKEKKNHFEIARRERTAKGYTGMFVIIKEENWNDFLKGLATNPDTQ